MNVMYCVSNFSILYINLFLFLGSTTKDVNRRYHWKKSYDFIALHLQSYVINFNKRVLFLTFVILDQLLRSGKFQFNLCKKLITCQERLESLRTKKEISIYFDLNSIFRQKYIMKSSKNTVSLCKISY